MALALRALGHKERSERELTEWLRERGITDAELEEVVSRLIESGGLDDERFAERFAADKRELAGWGPERIRTALQRRGIDAEKIEAVLAEEPEQELDRAQALLHSKGHELETERGRARALSFLSRRGYPSDIAYEAIRRVELRRFEDAA